ncbi:MAG: NAD-dependent aldehyde dehydrogenase, partial [Planctomycetes bacterium]|nr:NAD-dependent aldehyde dehydrogenase [Planctomycetota bacterium]
PQRRAYYPGADRKYDLFLAAHPEARQLAKRAEGAIPWTLIEGVDPSRADDVVFNQEAWCAVLAETALPARDPGEYLEAAAQFANNRLWGTLSASVLVDPRTEARLGGRVDDAVARLRYGSVAVNHWSALAYGLVVTTWGAFPGHTLENVGSGIGFVHNTGMFERPQKSVVRGPFTVSPKPPWFATHRNAHHVARRIARFESDPAYWRVPAIALAALRG